MPGSATYIAELIEEKYGVPYIKVDFFGPKYCAENLRAVGKYFGKEAEAEKVIESRMKANTARTRFLQRKT